MVELHSSGTLFSDSHGGLWVTCDTEAEHAVAFGPTGAAREVTLTDFIRAQAEALSEDSEAEHAGFIDGAKEALRMVGVQALPDLIGLMTREHFIAYSAQFCWVDQDE